MKKIIILLVYIFIILLTLTSCLKTEPGHSELHKAVINGDIDKINEMIKDGADLNVRNNFGMTPIFYSLIHNQDKLRSIFDALYYTDVDISIKSTKSHNLKNFLFLNNPDHILKDKIKNNKIPKKSDIGKVADILFENKILNENDYHYIKHSISVHSNNLENAFAIITYGNAKTREEAEKELSRQNKADYPQYLLYKDKALIEYPCIFYSNHIIGLEPERWAVIAAISKNRYAVERLFEFYSAFNKKAYMRMIKTKDPDDLKVVVIRSATAILPDTTVSSVPLGWEIKEKSGNKVISKSISIGKGYTAIPFDISQNKDLILSPVFADTLEKDANIWGYHDVFVKYMSNQYSETDAQDVVLGEYNIVYKGALEIILGYKTKDD